MNLWQNVRSLAPHLINNNKQTNYVNRNDHTATDKLFVMFIAAHIIWCTNTHKLRKEKFSVKVKLNVPNKCDDSKTIGSKTNHLARNESFRFLLHFCRIFLRSAVRRNDCNRRYDTHFECAETIRHYRQYHRFTDEIERSEEEDYCVHNKCGQLLTPTRVHRFTGHS